MLIGITCNIQGNAPAGGAAAHAPDDAEEEFDKPETIESIAAVLRGLGHEVEVLGDGPAMLRRLLDRPPKFVFNFAEGTGVSRSREARVPAVLEMLGIPYSGSDPLAMAATLDKDCAKRLVQSVGVRTPRWKLVNAECGVRNAEWKARNPADNPQSAYCQLPTAYCLDFSFPVIVKPAYEGSSKGIRSKCLVESPDELEKVVAELERDYRQPILIEEVIAGDEVTVGVIGNDPPRVLGLMRVLPTEPTDRFVYSLEVKRDYKRLVRYETPPNLPADVLAKLEAAALASYRVLGCRDIARVDFRLRDGEPYFLEVNPLPGLHRDNSDLVLLARGYGISHAELVRAIFDAACRRLGIESQ